MSENFIKTSSLLCFCIFTMPLINNVNAMNQEEEGKKSASKNRSKELYDDGVSNIKAGAVIAGGGANLYTHGKKLDENESWLTSLAKLTTRVVAPSTIASGSGVMALGATKVAASFFVSDQEDEEEENG